MYGLEGSELRGCNIGGGEETRWEDVTRMEVPTARLKLRPELVGRWSPVGVGGDVGGGGGSQQHQEF